MKKHQLTLLVVLLLCFVTKGVSQRVKITNGFGINGGITQFNILTNNFVTESSIGFLGGLSANVDIPQKPFNYSYGMQFSENGVRVFANSSPSDNSSGEFIEYKLLTAQFTFLMHYKLVPNYLTIDVGPMLQYNGKLELKDISQDNFYITNCISFYYKYFVEKV